MRNGNRLKKRFMSMFLCIALLISYIPTTSLAAPVTDSEVSVSAYGGEGTKVADRPTVNDWHEFFGTDIAHTHNAGMVWTDKSVFTSVDDYLEATAENENKNTFGLVMDDEENNFLVSLSAIASSKSVEGYSTLPTDTMLILDLSGSMITNQAVSAMVQSANDAIVRLQELNANNRVGVIAYSGNSNFGYSDTDTAEVILPLGKYTPGLDSNNRSAYLVSSWITRSGGRQTTHTGVKVANGVTGTFANGVDADLFANSNAKDADGGTYIQNGLYQAYEQFVAVNDTTVTSGIQAGVKRVPVMVLLSDGAPTTATTSYHNVGRSNQGNGDTDYANAGIAFLTQLTASWLREKVEEKYGTSALFYSLGLNVSSSNAARCVLDPSGNTATDAYWDTYLGLAEKAQNQRNMTVTVREGGRGNNDETCTVAYTDSVAWSADSQNYITQYYPASNATGLISAFSAIVQQIVIQSLYYPTHVEEGGSVNEEGFLTFEDYIGKNMEVKSIKGIQLGTTLYTGATLARMIYTGGMGTEQNPTDAGNNLVWSVQKRLGIDSVSEARALIGLAYANGQLYYNPETGEFSNYIGWYADVKGKFVGFWDGVDASASAVPAEFADDAVYAIKSFGYYDAVGEGHRKTDMMYATIQISTTLKTDAPGKVDGTEEGDVRLVGRLPAALIPLVEYNIDLNGVDPMDPVSLTIEGAEAPSRLIYEIGLSDDVDLLNLRGTAADSLDAVTGDYVFYTNQWQSILGPDGEIVDYSYKNNRNTVSYFNPADENERYYYNTDSIIYTDRSGTLYTGENAPDSTGTYYHREVIYTGQADGSVTAQWFYEPISEHVLTHEGHLEKRSEGGNTHWVVLKGTLHHWYGDYVMLKGNDNHTGTVHVSDMPFVHDVVAGVTPDEFHVDSYLGNNGRLTIDPYEGIRISKTVDDTIADKTGSYAFVITADDNTFNEECVAIYEDAEGSRTTSALTFVNGSARVFLSHGESVYILSDAMTGVTFTVAEAAGEGYTVGSVTVNGTVVAGAVTADLPVAADSIGTVDFVNTRVVNGDVVISKNVVSAIAAHEQKEFAFTVTVSGTMLSANDSFATVKSDGTAGADMAVGDNTITLKHGEYITIKELPQGASVTVTEADYSADGFTADNQIGSAVVTSGETKYIAFNNTYDAADTDPFSIAITGTKILSGLEGATWNGDFKFQLQRYNGTSYEKVENVGNEAVLSYPANTSFGLSLQNEVYPAAGTYSYRVVEIVDQVNIAKGIIYDTTHAYFNVIVSDNGEGELYVSNVTAVTDAAVSQPTADTWSVAVTFENTYRADGAAEVILNIGKTIDGTAGGVQIPPSGFTFALYATDAGWTDTTSGTPVATSIATGADGKTEIRLTYDQLAQIGDYYYLLKEVDDGREGVDYTERTYKIKVNVENTNGVYSATVQVDDNTPVSATAADSASIAVAETAELEFVNTYTPDSVTLRPNVGGRKNLIGRLIKEAGEFSFSLYETGSDFVIAPGTTGTSADVTVDGTFTFSDLTYDKAGTYYYVVKENIPAQAVDNKLNGVTYDASEYHITVTVTPDNMNGTLSATAVFAKNSTAVTEIVFTNTYVPEGTSAVISGSKYLGGGIRDLQARAFTFELLDANGRVIRTAENGASADGENASFAFGAITYNTVVSDTKTDVYTYTVREKLPAGVDAQNNKLNGVVYDTNEYTVTVSVTDEGNGKLNAVVDYSAVPGGAIQFNNSYVVTPTYIDLSGTKHLTGDDLSKYTIASGDAFYYELYPAKWDTVTQSVVQDGGVIARVTDDGTGSFIFDHDEIAALNFNAISAYRFIVRESVPANGDPLMIYDTSIYYIEVDVTDGLDGALVATPEITKVDARSNSVVITDNDGSGIVNDDIDFYNELDEEPVVVEIKGVKDYNVDLPAGKFTFDLYQALPDAQGEIQAVGAPVLEAENDADGNFLIKDITYTDAETGQQTTTKYLTFTEAGTYYFVVKEQLPDGVTDANKTKDGITYDLSSYVVKIVITDGRFDGTGRAILEKEVLINDSASGEITFENEYSAKADEGAVISGKKTLSGKNLEDSAFTFELYKATVGRDGKISYGSDLLDRKSNINGKFTFDEVKYESLEDVKTHYYVVKEQIPVGAGAGNVFNNITYDTAEYLVTVVVEDNGDGTLKVSDPVYNLIGADDKAADEVDEIVIKNIYTEPYVPDEPDEPQQPVVPEIPSPKTGETTNLWPWFVLLAVSGITLTGTLVCGRKVRVTKK